jgi:type I restriction enzyme, S subunit
MSEYLCLVFLHAALSKAFAKETRGIGIHHLGKERFASFLIPLPPFKEQEEIVRRAKNLFDYTDSIESFCRQAREATEKLASDLLNTAFQGELVEQNPDDESASILLARILSERIDQLPNPRTALTKKKATMKKLTAKSVKEVIFQLSNDMFSFEQLHQEIPSNYESLKDIIFELLSEPNPSITQFFDDSVKAMFFVRGNS